MLLATIFVFGVFGNLVTVTLFFDEGGPDLVVAVSGLSIVLTIGTTGGILNVGWDEVAALFNADSELVAIGASMTGSATASFPDSPRPAVTTDLTGGSAGGGTGQFFFAAETPPPPPAPPVVTLTFKGQKVYA